MIKRLSIFTFMAVVLSGCALQPQQLRQALDNCDQYGFDSLVHRRPFDKAITRVLCVPNADEIDNEVKYTSPLPWVVHKKKVTD